MFYHHHFHTKGILSDPHVAICPLHHVKWYLDFFPCFLVLDFFYVQTNVQTSLSAPTVCAESDMSGSDLVSGESDNSLSDSGTENAYDTLKEIRVKNVNKVVIGTLNINSLAPKFDELREIIGKNLDILAIQETKLDSSFPAEQFLLDGYVIPNRIGKIEIEMEVGCL